MSSKTKQQRKSQHEKRTPPPQPGIFRRSYLIMAVGMLAAGVGTWALFEYVIWNPVPSELLGKWIVTEGPNEGGTIDFYRGGTMVAQVNHNEMLEIIEAKVRVEDGKIIATLRNKFTGEIGTRVQTIKQLDRWRLVLEDERGNRIHLKRPD